MDVIGAENLINISESYGTRISTCFKGLSIYVINNAIVSGNPPLIFCFNHDGVLSYIIDESTNYEHTVTAINFNRDLVISPRIKYNNCALLNNLWCDNYFHWICESLPRLFILERHGFKGGFVVPAGKHYVKTSLLLCGITEDRIIEYDIPYVAEKLWITDKFAYTKLTEYHSLIGALRRKLTSPINRRLKKHSGLRVYIKRTHKRRVANEDDLLSLINRYDFVTLTMEGMDLRDQIELMVNADVLLAPHGAGMVNCLFMPRNSLVIELFSPFYVNPTCMPIISYLNHRYYMVCEKELKHHTAKIQSKDLNDSDIYADIDLIGQILKVELT